MRKLKLFFACLLMAVLSIGQVWAGTATATLQISSGVTANGNLTDDASNTWAVSSDGSYTSNNSYIQCGTNKANVSYIRLTTSAFSSKKITKVQVWGTSKANTNVSAKVIIGSVTIGTSSVYTTQNASSGGTEFSVDNTNEETGELTIEISRASAATGAIYFNKAIVTYEDGGDPDPVLESITISGDLSNKSYEEGQSIDFTGLTATGHYNNSSTADLTDDVEWSFAPALTEGLTSVTVTATLNEISGNKVISDLIVAAAPAAVEYAIFSGELEEGDYVIYYGGYAMNNTIANDRLQYTEVTPSDNKITNPDASIVWHIAQSGSYWTIYNAAVAKYAAGTGAKNKAQLLADGTDDKSLWTASGDETYDFVNKANDAAGVNKTLRNNGTYGFACYATSTGGPLSLYRKVDSSEKPSAEIAFAEADKNKLAKVGAAFTAPTLVNPNTVTVTYASSDADVVAVSTDGATFTVKAAGKAIITASFAGNDNYKAGTASYTIYAATEAGTESDALTEASAKALIDLGCAMNVHVKGTVKEQHQTYYTVTLTDDFKFWSLKDLGNVDFTTAYLKAGDQVTAYGQLTKVGQNYELAEGCYLTAYEEYTAPKTHIANTKETAYTIAQALAYAAEPLTYELTDHIYVKGVVYNFEHYTATSNIYIRDIDKTVDDGKFEFFKCGGLKVGENDPVPFSEDGVHNLDTVIGYGVMTYFSKNDIWEFPEGNYVVEHKHYIAPVVSVTGVDLNKESTSLEVGETETLVATVAPATATNKAVTWASDDETVATVDENGVVTAVAEGTTTITVTTVDGSFTDDCEVTVTAADPTKHVVTFDATVDKGESPLSKSNITFTCSNGVLNNESEYRLYKSSTTTFACSVGNITKIEFTGVSGNPVSGFGDPEEGTLVTDGNDGVWTGNAASVSFIASGAQVRATEIKVTYKEDSRAEAGLAWSAEEVEITLGDAFTPATLQNPNNIAAAEITIESDNENLAEVNAGVVSLVADATGTATITATFNGNDDYKPAVVSYTITVNEAGLDNVTFDATVDIAGTNELSISKGGFTLVFTDGALGNGENYRLYKSQTMTLSSTDYLIKKIEFTCTSGNPISGFADAAGLDKDNNEWTGESSTVELTASNAQVRMTKIKVFYVDDTRAAAGLAWNPADDIEITVGDAFSAPALLNPNSIDAAEITIESSNTSLATVTNGEVALVADATGTTTITATFAGNDDFKPATVSYKITVNPAYSIYVQPSLNVNFGSVNQNAEVADKKVTVTFTNVPAATLTLEGAGASAFTISPAAALTASGDITISASSANIGTFAATLTISDDANNAESKVVNISITVNEPVVAETAVATDSKWVPATEIVNGMQVLIVGERNEKIYAVGAQTSNNRTAVEGSLSEGVFTPGENTMAFTVVAQEGGTYALQASNGKYLYAAGSGSGKNYLRSQDEVDDNAKWTLSVSSATANGTNTNNKLQLNNSSDIFSCYSSTQKAIALYVPKPVVTYVAKIGETMYESLPAAVAAAQDGQTVELLMDVAAGPGVMITSAEHKQIIIDFGNHTYCANSPAVGSAGTQNQAFHFEKGCNITLQNGTITSSGDEIIMLIQNYGDLTLLNITLIGNNLPGTHRYVLSNNCGNVVIGDGTTITAKEGDVAFDVCVTNYYPEGTTVTVKEGATITGIVEYDVWGTIPADNKATLTIEGGNFDITWNVVSALAEDAKDNINVEGGTFSAEVPADYCAHGFIPKDNGNGQYGVYYAGYYERGSLTPGNYATICLPNGGKISGASLFDIEYYENSTLYLLEVEGNAMVAGRPYIFLPSSDKIEVTYTDAVSATAGSFNGLVGSLSLVAEVITPDDGNYILYNNQYWNVNSTAYVGANRAYIHMADVPTEPSTPQVGQAPRRRVAMTVNGTQTATGMDELNASETPVKVIIDGQLFIIRGEQMFNANGQLVK